MLASDDLCAPNEEAVYEHLERWMMAPKQQTAAAAEEESSGNTEASSPPPPPQEPRGLPLLRHIRFPLMDGAHLASPQRSLPSAARRAPSPAVGALRRPSQQTANRRWHFFGHRRLTGALTAAKRHG